MADSYELTDCLTIRQLQKMHSRCAYLLGRHRYTYGNLSGDHDTSHLQPK